MHSVFQIDPMSAWTRPECIQGRLGAPRSTAARLAGESAPAHAIHAVSGESKSPELLLAAHRNCCASVLDVFSTSTLLNVRACN
jgi:hypothetical protein